MVVPSPFAAERGVRVDDGVPTRAAHPPPPPTPPVGLSVPGERMSAANIPRHRRDTAVPKMNLTFLAPHVLTFEAIL